MPAYDYLCAACGQRFEVSHGVHEAGPTSCPLCGKGPVRKAISAAAVHYKGSGWAKKERRPARSSGDKDAKPVPDASGGDGGSSTESSTDSTKSDKSDKPDKPDKPDKSTPAPAKRVDTGPKTSSD